MNFNLKIYKRYLLFKIVPQKISYRPSDVFLLREYYGPKSLGRIDFNQVQEYVDRFMIKPIKARTEKYYKFNQLPPFHTTKDNRWYWFINGPVVYAEEWTRELIINNRDLVFFVGDVAFTPCLDKKSVAIFARTKTFKD